MTWTWDFESGANGDTLTPTNTGADSVVLTGGSGTISTAWAFTGTRSALMTATTANGIVAVYKTFTSDGDLTLDIYVNWTTLPSAELTIARMIDVANATCWSISVDSAGRIRYRDAAGVMPTAGLEPTAQAITTGSAHHIKVNVTAGTSAGSAQVRHYLGASTTTTWDSGTIAGQNTGANWTTLRVGVKAATATATGVAAFDNVVGTQTVTGTTYSKTITEAVGIADTSNPQGIDRSSTVGETVTVTDAASTNAYSNVINDLAAIVDDNVVATMSSGTPLSTSTVTPIVDDLYGPRVQFLVSPVPVSAATITVWRNYAGQRSIVRGASRAPVSGDTVVVDYWAPVGVPVFYTVQTFDAAGNPSQLSAPSASVTLVTADAWLSDPFDPASAMPIALTSHSGRPAEARFASFRTATYALANATVAPVHGSPDPIGFADLRQSAAGVPLEIRTFDLATFEQLRALLAQAYPLCVRAGATVPLIPGVAYLSITSVTPTFDPDNVTCTWSMVGDTVAPPGASVIIPAHTYDDTTAHSSSYDGTTSLYPTYIDRQLGAA